MKRLIAITVIAGALAFAAFASANVLVFTTKFSKQKDVQRIDRLVGGKACKKSWQDKKALGVSVKTGRRECVYQTPVEGDAKLPNHVLQATGIVDKKTNKKIRSQVYVGLQVRANARSSYEMRIFPKGRRFKVLKNGNELDSGKSKDINELSQKNRLKLEVNRSDLIAKVNGKLVGRFRDNNAEQVNGRKTALTFGSEARAKKDAYATFDSVKVFVPDP